jgi:ADP-sugar diphosphatase
MDFVTIVYKEFAQRFKKFRLGIDHSVEVEAYLYFVAHGFGRVRYQYLTILLTFSQIVVRSKKISLHMMHSTHNGLPIQIISNNPNLIAPALESELFQEWLRKVNCTDYFKIHGIDIQSVDFTPSGRVIFIKFCAQVTDISGSRVPGAVFLRGDAVAILLLLACGGETYAVLVKQPRFAIGRPDSLEIPAGMLDGGKEFVGTAAREIQEEIRMTIRTDELTELSQSHPEGIHTSPGACDEAIKYYVCEREVSPEFFATLHGRDTGLRDEGEKIRVVVVPTRELLDRTNDGKVFTAYALYQHWLSNRRTVRASDIGKTPTPSL